ncbi:MAG: response regulator transcription factor [Treponema sp.]|jgi:NarL family two-component system response regulator LiaR|nr:response regulator transcription factor [Treponema sp.]
MDAILLIDDHPLVRDGIGKRLEETGRFAIAGEAASLAQARSLLETMRPPPALIILDISLGTDNGLSFIPEAGAICKARGEKPPAILVYSMYKDPFLAQSALKSGASGYISKSADRLELTAAIDALLGGGRYLEKSLDVPDRTTAWTELTRRELEILTMIKRGLTNRQIADALCVSVRTVENHLGHIYLKTGAVSRRALLDM